MTILHVIRHGHRGGCESHLLELIKNLNRQDYHNIVVCLSYGDMVDELRAQNIHCTVWSLEAYSSLKIIRKIRALSEYQEVDLIHTHDRKSCNLSLYTAFRLKLPLLYNVHCWSFNRQQSPLKKYLARLNERFITHNADYNIIASQTGCNVGIKELKLPNSVVINHGVDLQHFNPDLPGNLSRRVFGIPENFTVVGFLARLSRRKDPLTLIQAAALALKEERRLHFLIVGDGYLREECLAETRKLGIANHVSFQNLKADVPGILRLFDIYCQPSQWEGFSVGLLEAMAMKKAIITSPVNANTELIAHLTDGMLVTAGKPESWKEAILKLHRDPQLRQDLGRQARMLVESEYNIKRTIARQELLYRKFNPQSTPVTNQGNQSEKLLHSL